MNESRHLFLTPDGRAHPRWLEAFPDALASAHLSIENGFGKQDVIWLSTGMPDAFQLARALRKRLPDVPLVLISLTPNEQEALQALDVGAHGYCHAWSVPELLRQVALVVSNGGLWVGPELLSRAVTSTRALLPAIEADSPRLSTLSQREREVALAVGEGLTNKEVARRLDITERTVKAHLSAVFEKLGVRDRLQLALHLSIAPNSDK